MANALYDHGRDGFLVGSCNWMTGTWVPYLVSSYNVSLANDTFLSDIPLTGNMWHARGTYLASRGHTAGIASCASSTVIPGVGSGGAATAVAVVLVQETGASNTSLLGAYLDTMSGLPFQPNGGDIQIDWDTTAAALFKL